MKNGIPVNTFEYYGYSNELITKEDYKPISTEKLKNNVIRGYILISNENGVLFSSLNFIVLKENYNSINLNQIKTVYNRLISYHGINQIKFKECNGANLNEISRDFTKKTMKNRFLMIF